MLYTIGNPITAIETTFGVMGSKIGSNVDICIFLVILGILVALGLAFATGTSWGTFGILIPIVLAVFGEIESSMLVMTVAACLAGAVAGDHISPISDTTILSSAGADCKHIDHVATQMPYAFVVIGACFVGYLVGGFVQNGYVALLVGALALVAAGAYITISSKKKA